MRRKDREITDIEEIEQLLNRADVCRIGLVDGDEPYIVPVSFGYENNAIYFHSAQEGRKVDLLKNNNKVCFEIDTDIEIIRSETACKWHTKYRSVIGIGKATFLTDNQEKVHGLEVIMRHYSPSAFQFSQDRLELVLVVRIDIDSMSGKKSGY